MDLLRLLFGEGRDLNELQMGCRAIVVILIAITFIHIAGLRTVSHKSAFDITIVIMLGAILSRAIVGVSPFLPTVTAAGVLVVMHRLLGLASLKSDFITAFVKGKKTSLYKHGELNRKNMKRCVISEGDLMEGVRLAINEGSLDSVEEIFMERTGEISVVKKTLNV
jgi:uncharacterized membrane protein YcaP (DUF421 family)